MMLGCERSYQPKAENYDSAYSMMSVSGSGQQNPNNQPQQQPGNHGNNQFNQWGYAMPPSIPMMPFNPEMAAAMFAQMPQMAASMPQQMPPFGHMPPFGKMAMPPMMHTMPQTQNHQQQKLVYNPPPISPPPQRERFSYTRYQVELLNKVYTSLRYPNSMQKQLLAKRVGITRDQVKIWFQNRRRKDVTGKAKDIDMSGPQMVPDTIMEGVMSELNSFKNNPKGKLPATSPSPTSTSQKRKRESDDDEATEGTLPESKMAYIDESSSTFPENAIKQEKQELSPVSLPSMSSYQNISHTSSSEQSSFGQSFNGSSNQQSPESYPAPSFPGTEPEFDMVNPPNVITPSAPLENLLEINPPSLESPASDGEELGAKPQPSQDDGKVVDTPVNDDAASPFHGQGDGHKESTAPPNKIAPPSEPISFPNMSSFNPMPAGLNLDLPTDLSVTAALARLSPEHDSQGRQALNTPEPLYCPTQTQSIKDDQQKDGNNNANGASFNYQTPMTQGYQMNASTMYPSHNSNTWFPNFPPAGSTGSEQTVDEDQKCFTMSQVCPFPMTAGNGMTLGNMQESGYLGRSGQYQGHIVNTMSNPYFESNSKAMDSTNYQQVVSPPQCTQ